MKSQKEVVKDLEFCKELLNRLLVTAKREGCDYHPSVGKNDITRLRRELNDVRRGMEWN